MTKWPNDFISNRQFQKKAKWQSWFKSLVWKVFCKAFRLNFSLKLKITLYSFDSEDKQHQSFILNKPKIGTQLSKNSQQNL